MFFYVVTFLSSSYTDGWNFLGPGATFLCLTFSVPYREHMVSNPKVNNRVTHVHFSHDVFSVFSDFATPDSCIHVVRVMFWWIIFHCKGFLSLSLFNYRPEQSLGVCLPWPPTLWISLKSENCSRFLCKWEILRTDAISPLPGGSFWRKMGRNWC